MGPPFTRVQSFVSQVLITRSDDGLARVSLGQCRERKKAGATPRLADFRPKLEARNRKRLQLGTELRKLDDRGLPLRPAAPEPGDEADHRDDRDAGEEPATDAHAGLRLGALGESLNYRRFDRGRRRRDALGGHGARGGVGRSQAVEPARGRRDRGGRRRERPEGFARFDLRLCDGLWTFAVFFVTRGWSS